MGNLVALQQYGCSFGVAKKVYVIREVDINPDFVNEILHIMLEVNTKSPSEFFTKTKICFLSNDKIYTKFLKALATAAKY